ncbi:MAG TPA: AI-2E family transporter [Candidatus Sulfotelmatobacter sp.]|nr:AI-2E family transporter [Candidatus Sulfotelmatobacter sp.]
MAFPDRRIADTLLTIMLFGLVLAILYAARRILLIFIFAILFAYLIDPVVRFLQRHSLFFKNLRGPHVAETYLAFIILSAIVAHGLAPQLSGKVRELLREAPTFQDALATGEIATKFGDRYGWSEIQELRLKALLMQHRDRLQSLSQHAQQFASNAVLILFVVPILAIFFLEDGGRITEAVIQLASTQERRQAIRALAEELNLMLRRYIRAKVTLGLCSLFFYSVTMLVLRYPSAIGLAVLGGVLEFIPVAGWMISAAMIVGLGILTHSHWIWMAVLLGVWRMLMDYFISPRVVGQNLEIHPLLVLFAMMVGGEVGGIVGIYLSIPLVVVTRVIWRRYYSAATSTELPSNVLQLKE